MVPDGDLTRELAATREQLRSLIERNGDAIVVLDAAGLVRFANPAAERLFRHQAQDLLGAPLGMPVVVGETTEIDIVGQSDQLGVAEMRVVETEWNGQDALLAVLRDITERKRAEQQREQLFQEQFARAQAEQALRERDDFLALASHELKTPAATLSATAQLLSRQLGRQVLEPAQLARSLDRIQDQSQRLARLVDHLLDVSRINAERLTIQPRSTDLVQLIAEVVAACQITTLRHTLVLRAPDRLEAVVDPDRMSQVVTNLVDNAIKYSPNGGSIDIDLSLTADDLACLTVRDRGVGVPDQRRDKLFERFYRAHADDQFSGMGLGLFITHHLVELHGGTIEADAPAGGGTRFTVRVPLHVASAQAMQ